MKNGNLICLDIGGTNLRIGLVDRSGRLTECRIISTAEVVSCGFVQRLTELIVQYREEIAADASVRGVSMGIPATVDKSRRKVLQAPNVPGLNNQPIADRLEEALGLPVFLERDVNLLLAYDLSDLRLPAEGMTIGVYFGTGVGNSICWNGVMLAGKNGVAGELGHVPQLYSHVLCGCGNESCIEPLGGGRRLEELCETVFPDTPVSQIYFMHGDAPEVREQVSAMAVAVATEVNILDPDHIVIGGGLIQMQGFPMEYFTEQIRSHVRKPYPMENLDIRFSRSEQENGIIGAGIYGWKKLEEAQAQT